MRQILMNSGGVVVARVPRPIVERGSVLVRVQYSLVSVGTEIAPLRTMKQAAPDSTAIERGVQRAELLRHYFRASLRDPRKAADRLAQIARREAKKLLSSGRPAMAPPVVSAETAGPQPPASDDLDAQGWNIGYSAAGEVVALGEG